MANQQGHVHCVIQISLSNLTPQNHIASGSECGLIRIVLVEDIQAIGQPLSPHWHNLTAGYFLVLHKKHLCVFVQVKEDLSPRKTI